MIKIALTVLLSLSICLSVASTTALAQIVVIVNPANPYSDISKKELSKIFKQKRKTWKNKGVIHVVQLPKEHPLREEFSKKVLKMSSEALEKYYFKKALSGKGQPPKILSSPSEVKSYVSGNENAIGYIDASDVDTSVKILKVDGKDHIE